MYHEDPNVQEVFTGKKAANEIWQGPPFLIVSYQPEKQPQVDLNHITLAVRCSVYSEESSVDFNSTFSISSQLIKLLFTSMASSASHFKTLPSTFSCLLPRGTVGRSGMYSCYFGSEKMKVQRPPCQGP